MSDFPCVFTHHTAPRMRQYATQFRACCVPRWRTEICEKVFRSPESGEKIDRKNHAHPNGWVEIFCIFATSSRRNRGNDSTSSLWVVSAFIDFHSIWCTQFARIKCQYLYVRGKWRPLTAWGKNMQKISNESISTICRLQWEFRAWILNMFGAGGCATTSDYSRIDMWTLNKLRNGYKINVYVQIEWTIFCVFSGFGLPFEFQ